MKGLELCERYFRQIALPIIEKTCGALLGRMAIGLVGDGSECFGYDDEISRDHDWGPGFCIWLNREVFDEFGEKIQAAYDKLPESFEGFAARHTSQWGGGRVGVLEIGAFYRRFVGMDSAPQTLKQWLIIPENALAAAVNGKVFQDPPCEFSAIRNTLKAFYPEDVRLKKIAARCMTAGQAGQYNFPRCVKRSEPYAAHHAEFKFMEDAVSLVFLLNKTYTPFYKWSHRALRKLPVMGSYAHGKILELLHTRDLHLKADQMESLTLKLIETLKGLGLSDSDSDFLPDHGPMVQGRIQDPELRGYDVWAG
jgi:hypothetical protein